VACIFDPEVHLWLISGIEQLTSMPQGNYPVFFAVNNQYGAMYEFDFFQVSAFVERQQRNASYNTKSTDKSAFKYQAGDLSSGREVQSSSAADRPAKDNYLFGRELLLLDEIIVTGFNLLIHFFLSGTASACTVAAVIEGKNRIAIFNEHFESEFKLPYVFSIPVAIQDGIFGIWFGKINCRDGTFGCYLNFDYVLAICITGLWCREHYSFAEEPGKYQKNKIDNNRRTEYSFDTEFADE